MGAVISFFYTCGSCSGVSGHGNDGLFHKFTAAFYSTCSPFVLCFPAVTWSRLVVGGGAHVPSRPLLRFRGVGSHISKVPVRSARRHQSRLAYLRATLPLHFADLLALLRDIGEVGPNVTRSRVPSQTVRAKGALTELRPLLCVTSHRDRCRVPPTIRSSRSVRSLAFTRAGVRSKSAAYLATRCGCKIHAPSPLSTLFPPHHERRRTTRALSDERLVLSALVLGGRPCDQVVSYLLACGAASSLC